MTKPLTAATSTTTPATTPTTTAATAAATPAAILRINDVSVVRRLHDVTLDLGPGLTVVIGENGAGKSTLLDVLAGILAPSSGTVSLCESEHAADDAAGAQDSLVMGAAHDADLRTLSPRQRARRIASLGQESIDHDTTVLERIAQGLAPRRGSGALVDDLARVKVLAIARALGVDALLERDVDQLSSGQRRRVDVARALVDDEAACVIVDEPHAAVDIKHQGMVSLALVERARAGTIVIVSVHDLGIAATIADRIIGLRDGRVVVDDGGEAALTSASVELLYGVTGALIVRGGAARGDGVAVIIPADDVDHRSRTRLS